MRCGENLGAVLTGAADARELLFSDASFAAMRTFYREAPPSRTYNALVAGAVAAAAESLGGGGTVRILELGAGTGGTTAAVLPGLTAERTRYVLTDVSPAFLSLAREEFGATPFVEYRPLDLEEDPREQGFEEGSFDVVLAANVVHATTDLAATLERVKTLLAPGGLLVLLEITRHPRWLDLVFGLTEGWWKFSDAALRATSPLLKAPAWQKLLDEIGFEEASVLTDAPATGDQAQSVLLARAPSRAPAKDAGWLILADRRGVGVRLAGILSARGQRVEVAAPDESAAGVLRRLRARDAGIAHVVHLRSLDAPLPEDASADALLDAQALVTDSALELVQALARSESAGRLKLWLVTSGAQAVDELERADSLAQSRGSAPSFAKATPRKRSRFADERGSSGACAGSPWTGCTHVARFAPSREARTARRSTRRARSARWRSTRRAAGAQGRDRSRSKWKPRPSISGT